MKKADLDHIAVIVQAIILKEDMIILEQYSVIAIYTPKDFHLNKSMPDIVSLADNPVKTHK